MRALLIADHFNKKQKGLPQVEEMIPGKNVKNMENQEGTKNTEKDKYLHKYNNVDCVKQR